MMKVLGLALSLTCAPVYAQDFFEGVVVYKHEEFDKENKKIYGPIDFQEVSYAKETRMMKITKGPFKDHFGDNAFYLDINKNVLYDIDFDNHIIYSGRNSTSIEKKEIIEFSKKEEALILDRRCDVYFIRYIHQIQVPDGFGLISKTDTTTRTYYISQNLKVYKPEAFSQLQHNKSTLNFDGRFDGVTLKVITENTDGKKICIEAVKTEIKPVMNSLPDFPIKKESRY